MCGFSGRGPLAGPVVVAACYVPNDMPEDLDAVIQDSKKMNEEEREHAYSVLMAEKRIKYAVSIVSHTEIDEINILQASLAGMRRSTVDLLNQLKQEGLIDKEKPSLGSAKKGSKKKVPGVDSSLESEGLKYVALVDGNKVPADMPVDCQAIVKGDSRIYSIAAASIIAKVTRDEIMVALDKQYPQYNFAQHKGYPTAAHRALVMQHGPCPVHRRSYGPVKAAMAHWEKKLEKSEEEVAVETSKRVKRSGGTSISVDQTETTPTSKKRSRAGQDKFVEETIVQVEEAAAPVKKRAKKELTTKSEPATEVVSKKEISAPSKSKNMPRADKKDKASSKLIDESETLKRRSSSKQESDNNIQSVLRRSSRTKK